MPDTASPPAAGSEVTSQARVLFLDEGLYSLSFADGVPGAATGALELPATLVTAPPATDYDPVEILASSGDTGAWLGAKGGTVVAKSPPGGGIIVVTRFGAEPGSDAAVQIRRLDAAPPARGPERPASPAIRGTAAAPLPPAEGRRGVRHEMLLHIQMQGDRRFVDGGWAGNRDARLQIEGFAIRPLEALQPTDIEYKAFGPNGLETPWISDGKLCGTRGRGLPLTGFAVRLTPRLREQFDVVYEGAFFDSGAVGPRRNGEPCRALPFDEPLAAINLHIVGR